MQNNLYFYLVNSALQTYEPLHYVNHSTLKTVDQEAGRCSYLEANCAAAVLVECVEHVVSVRGAVCDIPHHRM